MSYIPRLGEQFILEGAVSDLVCVCKIYETFWYFLTFYKQKKQPHGVE